ncbi:hypothetical protein BDK51DRAFT_32992 [Blyttiomyces helicus]|uniref:Uncharacterized protein n=1 Tax=Blyttiomyces helicus TaxID=388810 RepID=A0A4P9VZK6_9FUNG|nr:hypothetical protein BDK51DRAFT_32992 [Blyttiomyces helicus]|eukprot:RKO84445.1 hypothetical protein BDK51DRAFT_32992 [Blyttiomyces helicus]
MDAKGDAVDVNGQAEYHQMDFVQSDSLTLPLSCAWAVAHDKPVFGADKDCEVKQEDLKNHTAEDGNEDGIFDNEIEGDGTGVTAIVLDLLPTQMNPEALPIALPLLKRQPAPETTLDDILAEAPSTSDMATTGGSATFGMDGYWNKAATRKTTKTIAAAKSKAKKDQPTPVEDAYTCDPCLKKLKPTDPDTGAVIKELIILGQRVSTGTSLIKKSNWPKIASAKAPAKAQVKIAQMKMQHDLELAKLHLQKKQNN